MIPSHQNSARKVIQEIVAFLLCTLCLCILRSDLIKNISRDYFGGGRLDGGFYAWLSKQLTENVFAIPSVGFNLDFFYPFRQTLAFGDNFLLPGVFIKLISVFTPNNILAYNLCVLVAIILNGYFAYKLVFYLTHSYSVGLFGGLAFMLYPFSFLHLSHLQLQFAFFLPLTLLCFFAFWERRSRLAAIFLCSSIFGAFMCSVYYALSIVIILILSFAVMSLLEPRRLNLKALRLVFLASLPWFILLIPLLMPYLNVYKEFGPRPIIAIKALSGGLLSYVSAPYNNIVWGKLTADFASYERQVFSGLTVIFFAVVYFIATTFAPSASTKKEQLSLDLLLKLLIGTSFFTTLRTEYLYYTKGNTGWRMFIDTIPLWIVFTALCLTLFDIFFRQSVLARAKDQTAKAVISLEQRNAIYFFSLWFTFVFLSLGIPSDAGPTSSLFGWLITYIPGFDILRAPGRLGVVSHLFLVCAASLGLKKATSLIHTLPVRPVIVGLITAFLLYEYQMTPLAYPASGQAPKVYDALAQQHPKSAVVGLPVNFRGQGPDIELINQTAYMQWITSAGMFSVNGYSGLSPYFHQSLFKHLTSFPSPEALEALSRIIGLNFVTYHGERNPYFDESIFLEQLHKLKNSTSIIAQDGHNYLLHITPTFYSSTIKLFFPPTGNKSTNLSFELVFLNKLSPETRHLAISKTADSSPASILSQSDIMPDTPLTFSITIPPDHRKVEPSSVVLKIEPLLEGESFQLNGLAVK